MTYTYCEDIVSDLYKDTTGVRPSAWWWDTWTNATPDLKQEIWDDLLVSLDTTIAEEKAQEQEAIDNFNARIADCLSMGAKDSATAIRWIVQGLDKQDVYYDFSYGCYLLGLPYSYANTLKEAHLETV